MDDTLTTRPRLRPGWRILLTIAGMFGFVGAGIGASLLLSAAAVPWQVAYLLGPLAMSAAAVAIAYCLRRFADRRPWAGLGLTWRATDALRLLAGGGLAAIVVVTIKAATVALGLSQWEFGYRDDVPIALGLALGYLSILLGQAFPEELLWRGYLFASLSAERRRRTVIIATSVGFGAMHVISNPGADAALGWRLLYAVMACGLGFALAACRVRGSLWLAVGFHAGHNLAGGMLGTGAYDLSLLVSFGVFCGFGAVMLWTSGTRGSRRPEAGVVEMPTQSASER